MNEALDAAKRSAALDPLAALFNDGEAEATAIRHAFEQGGYKAILEKQLSDLKEKAATAI